MAYKTIRLEEKDRVARITLNRPEALNALSPELLEELEGALAEIRANPNLKAVVVTGEGRAFSAGADLKFIQSAFADISQFMTYLQRFNRVMLALTELPIPTVAMVNGFAFAGGIELLLSCDMAIAAEDARIGDQHMNFGLVGGPVMWQLPNRIGYQRAMELVCSGKWLSGKEAAEYGIVLRAVPKDKLEAEVEALVNQLRNKSLPGLKVAKQVLRGTVALPEREALEFIAANTTRYMALAEEPKEGVKAFVEKRQPVFK